MTRRRIKLALVFGAAVLLVAAVLVTLSPSWLLRRGRTKLPVGQGIPAIALGQSHGLVLASDGSLWSWGANFLGWPVLGLGQVRSDSRLHRIGHETNWVSITAGNTHNLAIKSDGTLWAWGENVHGQLGLGLTRGQLIATNVPALAAPGNDWKQAAAGGCFSLALKTNGTLWAWGNNWAGPLGIGSTNNSAVPVQVGTATSWTRVWAGSLESVALQSDGSLWYWGENPNPTVPQGAQQVLIPTRVSPDTNWVDVGFGEATVFGIQSDGTLWAWGRNAQVYTGATDPALNATPRRVGTNSDWRSISAGGGWWCQGLTKKDGSLWFMDASDSQPNGPRSPFKPAQFRRVELSKAVVAYTAGAAHAAAPGEHFPVGVALTREGEVWTWGMVLGDPPGLRRSLQALGARLAAVVKLRIRLSDPKPVVREKPWRLPVVEPAEKK